MSDPLSTSGQAQVKPKIAWYGWVAGGVFLLYSLGAAFDYVMSMVQGAVYYRASGMNESQVAYFLDLPWWTNLGWAMSVWGGLLGAAALLLRLRISREFFGAALLGNLLYILYTFALSAGREAMGGIWFMPLVICALTAALLVYSHTIFGHRRSQ